MAWVTPNLVAQAFFIPNGEGLMNALQLDIDGFIGNWGYSKSYVKNFLAEAGKSPVTVRVSSLGGDVDHAIAIYDQFAEHGEVTIHLSAFNASAATLITLSAKRILMNSNGFYLIHKALNWVDAWGNMNEDDIDALILSLEAEKKMLEKVTLVLAKMYSKRTGKTTSEILNLMKQETWLTAEEALAWGFIDEIKEPATKENLLSNTKMVIMLNYSDLPLPVLTGVVDIPCRLEQTEDPIPGMIQKITASIKNTINSIFSMKQLTTLNLLLGIPSLESTDDGIYINEAQSVILNTHLEGIQQSISERDAAVTERTSVIASLDAIDPTIAAAETIETKVAAIRTILAAKPAVAASGVQTAKDAVPSPDGVDWATLNALPHMQEDKY
ncbi:MAG: Clp protease ClpP [Porphyromonadaceae bacterium]|nr:MAG: Clp protease ClpP [Porphyromonadaceae bacterium]